jgi:nucleoside-diphosphate-sugar epimerase
MRILITGAAGFLGSHLTDLLLEQGHDVVGVDNFITGKEQNIAHLKRNPRYNFIRHDVIEPLAIDGAIDRIYHMASPASPAGYVKNQIATMKVNSQGTWNLLELSLASSGCAPADRRARTMWKKAATPSRQVIFLPSA